MANSFTKLYLTTKTAPYTPSTIRGAWDNTAGAVTKSLDSNPNDGGIITTVSRSESSATANYDVLLYRGISGPLAAQTFSGTINVILGVAEANTTDDNIYHIHVYVTQGDSDTPRGDLLTDYIETITEEWSTGFSPIGQSFASAQTLAGLAISAGDRIVVEIGYRSLNAGTDSFGALSYGTQNPNDKSITDLVAGDNGLITALRAGTLQFSNSVTEVDLTERVTQFIHEAPNEGTKQARVTQFIHEASNEGTNQARVSQFIHEAPNEGTNQARITQFIHETVSNSRIRSRTYQFIVT